MKNEVAQGLRNAVKRGFSLESAAKSFINAGYDVNEVKEAVDSLQTSVSSLLPQPAEQSYSEPEQKSIVAPMSSAPVSPVSPPVQPKLIPSPLPMPQRPQMMNQNANQNMSQKNEVSTVKVVILGAILLILLILLGVSVFFKDSIMSLFG